MRLHNLSKSLIFLDSFGLGSQSMNDLNLWQSTRKAFQWCLPVPVRTSYFYASYIILALHAAWSFCCCWRIQFAALWATRHKLWPVQANKCSVQHFFGHVEKACGDMQSAEKEATMVWIYWWGEWQHCRLTEVWGWGSRFLSSRSTMCLLSVDKGMNGDHSFMFQQSLTWWLLLANLLMDIETTCF